MEGAKFVKARCRKTGKYFALEVKRHGTVWRVINPSRSETKIVFGFKHDGHRCELLSHATLNGIKMTRGVEQ